MKNTYYLLITATIIFTSCSTTAPLKKSVAYKGMYDEKPTTILLMPPINKSTNVEAKEYFHSTLIVPLANQGFYVIPPFLSMEILKRESAYDAELFLNSSLSKFGEVFGADIVLFTIIHKWDKSYGNVKVEVEYILKSTKTNEILYTRRGTINYNTTVSGTTGAYGALADVALTAANTIGTKYVDVAKICNTYTFKDLPVGKYSPINPLEPDEMAGKKVFKVNLNSQYK
jgi:hypothetical protein